MNANDKPSADAREVAKALDATATALRNLGNGNAGTQMGAIEAFGKAYIEEQQQSHDVTSEQTEALANAITTAGKDIYAGLAKLAEAIQQRD